MAAATEKMNRVSLGSSGVEVSGFCLGTDSIGSRVDRESSFQVFDTFFENGGSFLDTANFYAAWLPGCQGGESETTLGEWIRERDCREQVQIASKLGFDYPGSPGGLSKSEIERECDKSLKRLGTDYLDLYYAHCDDRQTPLAETMEAFDRLVKAGKVRAVAASNLKGWRIAEASLLAELRGWSSFVAVQQRFTYLRPRHGADFGPQIFLSDDVVEYCQAHGKTLIGYSVLLQGAYTRSDRAIPAQFTGTDSESRLAVLMSIAAEVGVSPNRVILAWMRQGTPSILPIIAGSRPEQIIENLGALDLELSPAQMTRLTQAGNPDLKETWIR